MVADFPRETGWLSQDFDTNQLADWFKTRDAATQEADLLARVLGAGGAAADGLRKDADALLAASAPAGDARWLDLYMRGCRLREVATAVGHAPQAPRAALEKELTDLAVAKAGPDDILIRITIANHGPEAARLHVLPTLWYRNTWSWGAKHEGFTARPNIKVAGKGLLEVEHPELGKCWLAAGPGPDGTA